MMYRGLHLFVLSAGVALATVFSATSEAAFVPFNFGGDNTTTSITPTITSFLNSIGATNNGNNLIPQPGGHREINWDGGGATTGVSNPSPLDLFLNIRGARLTTTGSSLLQTPVNDPLLTNINATYATTFTPFSLVRIFTPVGSNVTDVTFFLPGSNGLTPASVNGFGAVFSDVDLPNTTRLDFFGLNNNPLISLNVAPGTVPTGSFSFAGEFGNAGERISRVRITTGTGPLGPTDNPSAGVDMVVMDDFFFGEPQAIPAPTSLALFGLGILGLLGFGHARRAATG